MTTRIYRQSPGRWVAVTHHPSGGVVRETYTSGRAALIALDGRNRERRAAIELTFTYELASDPGRRERRSIEAEPIWPPKGTCRDDRTGLEESMKVIAGWGVSPSEFLDNVRAAFYRPAVWGKRDTGVIR